MADVDPKLVELIARQVLTAIRQAGGQGQSAPTPAQIHAPIGICTGDYSKFPELAHLRSTEHNPGIAIPGRAETPAEPAPVAAVAPAPKPLPQGELVHGVVTAGRLKKVRGTVILAKGAQLSPLAQDFVKEHQIKVVAEGDLVSGAVQGGPTISGQWSWWIDGACPSVARVVEALSPHLLASREKRAPENLKGVVRELAAMVRTGRVKGGVLFVSSAARAVCYANRCRNLRAVVGTCDQAVAEGIELLGANVLVLEYPHQGFKSMHQMVRQMMEQSRELPAEAARDLEELRNCG